MELNPVFDSAPPNAGPGIISEPVPVVDSAIRQLTAEYVETAALFALQSPETAEELENQAATIALALTGSAHSLRFRLPSRVHLPSSANELPRLIPLPEEYLQQILDGVWLRRSAGSLRSGFRMRLADLEQARCVGVALAARLIRFAAVRRLVYDVVPAGNPSLRKPTQGSMPRTGRLSPAAFVPEWIALDPDGHLTVASIRTAEGYIARMQTCLEVLNLAISLAPYMFADREYQFRRHHMLIQLIHQSQMLAAFQTRDTIRRIRQLAAEGLLNLGLSLSLPYFDDQSMQIRLYDFPVIPGRTSFIPAFVALAARREQLHVAQATNLSQSTRLHLLSLLKDVELAFAPEA